MGSAPRLLGSAQVAGDCGSAPTAMGRWSAAVLVGSAALEFGTGHGEGVSGSFWVFYGEMKAIPKWMVHGGENPTKICMVWG